MRLEPNGVAYELNHDLERLADCLIFGEDVAIQEYDGYNEHLFYEEEHFEHPSLIIYQGYLEAVKHLDYLLTDNSWDVMSKRMYEVLLSVGEFSHQAIPIAVVDWKMPKNDWFDSKRELKEGILTDYLALHLTEHLNIFDFEKSEYTKEKDDGYVDRVDEYVFKIPEQGLSPIFKIPEMRTRTFVSMEARKALKEAGIKGLRYIPLDGAVNREINIDVPVVLSKEVQNEYCKWIQR